MALKIFSQILAKNMDYFKVLQGLRADFNAKATFASGDSQGTNTKIDDLMKKLFFRCNSLCFTHLFLLFTGKTNIQKV